MPSDVDEENAARRRRGLFLVNGILVLGCIVTLGAVITGAVQHHGEGTKAVTHQILVYLFYIGGAAMAFGIAMGVGLLLYGAWKLISGDLFRKGQ